jgi:hypothetical protein
VGDDVIDVWRIGTMNATFAGATGVHEVRPMRCYVGEVQAATDAGIRMTMIDWLVGMSAGLALCGP